jgi:hypothetical protein
MFRDKAFFKSLQPASGNVILGDGKTSLPIQGIGTILLQFVQHVVSVPNVRYVPDLAESICSLFSHIKCHGHELHSSFEDGLFLGFLMFCSKAIVGSHDIYLDAVPVSTQSVLSPSGSDSVTSVSVCTSLSHLSDDAIVEPSEQDNLIYQLHQYYHDVKTKRQLNFEVPAGFRQTGFFQRNLKDHCTATNTSDLPIISMLYEESTQDSTS